MRGHDRGAWSVVGPVVVALAACGGDDGATRGSASSESMGFTTEATTTSTSSEGSASVTGETTTTTAAETTSSSTAATGASICGDGVVTGDETCDDANLINDDACLNSCQVASCGDGFLQAGVEVCDDGNDADDDGCVACEVAFCGDGEVYVGVEACDDGNQVDNDGCTNECVAQFCGDGQVMMGEECDEGGESATCDADCTVAQCGDGTTNATSGEACDDGNTDDDDACVGACQLAFCGDGLIQFGVESCDDGNMSGGDGCEVDCSLTPKYTAVGPQQGIEQALLIGWTPCYTGTYKESAVSLAVIMANCSKANLMMGCRPTGASKFTALAHAPREDVLFDTGTGNTPHNANGVGWYFSGVYSWGFAKQGDPIQRSACDTLNSNGAQRLCWHTNTNNLGAGWRCGTITNQTSDLWERVILHAD